MCVPPHVPKGEALISEFFGTAKPFKKPLETPQLYSNNRVLVAVYVTTIVCSTLEIRSIPLNV